MTESKQKLTFSDRLLRTVIAVTVAVIIGLLVFATSHVLVMFFTGIMLALLFKGLASLLARVTPLSGRLAVGSVLILIVVLLGAGLFFFGPRLASELDDLSERLPQSVDDIEQSIRATSWGSDILDALPDPTTSGGAQIIGSSIFTQFTGLVSTALGFLLDIAIILIIGVYLALEPSLYVDNFLRLVPPQHRDRGRDILKETGDVLTNWLIARGASVLVVTILTIVGLLIIGMPLVLTLGVIAGVLSFIPNLGPILGMIPAVLVGFTRSPEMALYVVILYLGVQTIESYFITPNIQRYTLSLPPALVISLQITAALLLGPLAVFVAAPALAAVIVLVKNLYVEEILGDTTGSLVRYG